MLSHDDLLERKIEALEKGQPLERVLAGMPEEAKELEPLLHLALAIRTLPHPQPVNALARQALERAAAREKTRPIAHPRVLSPQPRILRPSRGMGLAIGFAAAMLAILLTFTAFFSLGFQRARAATLLDVTGVARVTSGNVDGRWDPAEDGLRVHAGQRIITGPDSSLTLVFNDGSRMTLGPYSYVTLDELSGGWGSSLHLVATQHTGATQNSVVPLVGSRSAYNIITPAGMVSVHGTQFSVAVGMEGASRFAVDTGEVVVSGQGSKLALGSGQAATAKPGMLPGIGDYQFSLDGEISGVDGQTWIVNGVSFSASDETLWAGNIKQGMQVSVNGRVTQDGERVADSITSLSGSDSEESSFTGIFQSVQGDTWLVDGVSIHVGEATELGNGIALNKPVKVEFVVGADGSWDALQIESLDEADAEPEVTESPEATEPITPTETVTPTEDVTPTETVSPTTFVNCTGANPQPKAKKLAEEHHTTYEEIMGYFCGDHLGFGEIDHLYTLSETQGVSLTTILDMRLSGLGWGQIKKMWPTWPITPTGDITSTILPTATLIPTTTILPTTTLTITETEFLNSVPPKNNRSCPRSSDIPKAQQLGGKYGVSPELIGGLFCKGFGFGEIDIALGLGNGDLASLQGILTMRSNGLGWGVIKNLHKNDPTMTTPGNQNNNGNKPSGGGQNNQSLKSHPGHGPKPKKNH